MTFPAKATAEVERAVISDLPSIPAYRGTPYTIAHPGWRNRDRT